MAVRGDDEGWRRILWRAIICIITKEVIKVDVLLAGRDADKTHCVIPNANGIYRPVVFGNRLACRVGPHNRIYALSLYKSRKLADMREAAAGSRPSSTCEALRRLGPVVRRA
jgi:hypothetical protein